MRALNRKLLRDLYAMKGQAFAIALVIASGVAVFVMSITTLNALRQTRADFYKQYFFADVFLSLKRAPEGLRLRIKEIPGVGMVETRVAAAVNLTIKDYSGPVTGQLFSVPDSGKPLLNKLYLRQGRMIEAGRDDEVIVSEVFAQSHGFKPGSKLSAVINGRRKNLTIVGIGLSPEHVYQIAPGSLFPDFERYGILWMGRKPLGTAYNMEGAFNNVTLTLSPGAQIKDVIERLDKLIEPYGGLGAYGRKDQLSNRYLSEEFRQLGTTATIFPIIFLGVAAFLLNLVVSRLINMQREQVAALKAFGYSNYAVGLHYLKLIILIILLGVAGGVLSGVWFGRGLSEMYMEYYRFPFLIYEFQPGVAAIAALISIAAGITGALYSVQRGVRIPPAEAMRPEPPATYRETWIEHIGLKRIMSQPSRMIIRHIERKPVKALLSTIGIAFACAIMIVGCFFQESIDFMVDVHFRLSQREDLAVTFVEPASKRALFELQSLPGVEYGEAFRSVPVRLRYQHRTYRTAIMGVKPGGDLQRLLNSRLQPFDPPREGILLTDYLGDILGVRVGDKLSVEVLEGSRPVRMVSVAGLVSQCIGVSAYMNIEALNNLMREGNAISGVYLAADPYYHPEILSRLNEMPRVAGIVERRNAVKSFYETISEQLIVYTSFMAMFAATIAFGVVYNSARIALSERSRELASMRVLGLTRGEISYILLGELAVLTLAAIPLGCLIGYILCAYFVDQLQTDLYRIPLIVESGTYALAATVVLVSAIISGSIVRRRLDRLDLIAVLKTRE